MGLSCELPPVVLAEFYAMLQESYANRLSDRFDLLEEDPDLLVELAGLYELAHEFRRTYPQDFGVLEPMDLSHGQLATWLIAVLPGPSVDFSQELHRRSQERLRESLSDTEWDKAGLVVPTVVGWCLGSVPGRYDRSFPAVFAEPPSNKDVRSAYEGLVEHLVFLGESEEPWGEMTTTAVVLRCAGLAQGVQPGSGLGPTLSQLMVRVRDFVPEQRWRQLNLHWDHFRGLRDAFAHVAERDGRSFDTERTKVQTREDLIDCLTGVTYFVASTIREQLLDPEHDLGRKDMLRSIRDELDYLRYQTLNVSSDLDPL